MSTLNNSSPATKAESIPFWRDGRIIGILLQIIFVILLVRSSLWLVGNIAENLDALGPGQFICRDGSSSFRCAFDFLSADAQFDIQESVIDYTPADSYWRAIAVGMLNTAKVSIIGIILTTILGTITGIARLSDNWLVRNIAKWYIDLMRNTPLLLQLFFLYFVIFLGLAGVNEAIQPLNLPIYISQRGVNYPSFVRMTSFSIWFAFIILGIIQAQVLWTILGRREEITGHSTNRLRWVIVSFLLIVGIGWFIASNDNNEAMLVSKAARVREFDDLAGLLVRRLPVTDLVDVDTALESGALSQEDLGAAALQICAIKDSPSEVNLTTRLRRAGIPYNVTRFDRPDQAIESYSEGSCEIFVASRAVLAGERDLLEDSNAHLIVPLAETPVRLSMPKLEGFNFVGGGKMSTEFTALLIGLVLFTAAFVAEIVRAGIQSVSKGQTEAARALGLSESQRLQLVVLPQALRVIIPPLTSQYLNLTKNSSLALAVAFPDLYRTIDTMINQSGRSLQLVVIMAAIYLSISLIISAFLNWYNKQIALVER
ncbi:MAG: ABC transporter permease subunit [Ardenticatenaceae bacterium]|nr:ABC transporter permease subunit [Ardenticatenaceae bacterium]MCB9445461.1 ABC transporter permease subunit [Ardenticatenaceae bacterium]